MSTATISRLERGHIDGLSMAIMRRIAATLDITLDLTARWKGGEVDRMLSRSHSMLHESFARHLRALGGWIFRPEVSYSIYGERGVIDMLAWHEARAMVLVVEFKTELVDVNDLVGSMDRRRRLAIKIAGDFGWRPVGVSTLVVLTGRRTNRRRVADHRTVLRAAFPFDGRHLSAWLRDPSEAVAILTMWPDVQPAPAGPGRPGPAAEARPLRARGTEGAGHRAKAGLLAVQQDADPVDARGEPE